MRKNFLLILVITIIFSAIIQGCSNDSNSTDINSQDFQTIQEENVIEVISYELNGISFEVPNVWKENPDGTSSEDIIGFVQDENDKKRLTVRYQLIPDFMKINTNSDLDILNPEDIVQNYTLSKNYEVIEGSWIQENNMKYYMTKFYIDSNSQYALEYILPINNNEAVYQIIMLLPEENSDEFKHMHTILSSVTGIEFEEKSNDTFDKIVFETLKNNLETILASNNLEIGNVVESDGKQFFKIKSDYGINIIGFETNEQKEITMLAVVFEEMPTGGLNQYLFSVAKVIQSFDITLNEEAALSIVYDNADGIVNKNGVSYYYDSNSNSLLVTVD